MTDIATTRTAETVAMEIKALRNQSLACAIEIGRRLYEAKELVPHGEWGEWLKTELEFSQSSANKLMQLFNAYGSPQSALFGAELNSPTFTNLSVSNALRLLSLPEDEREEFAKDNNVENMSARELAAAIKERDEALKAKAAAERLATEADEGAALAIAEANDRAEKASLELKAKEAKVLELTDLITELKSEPIDVTVTPEPDPSKLQEAIEKAKAEVAAENKKKIAELEKTLKAAEKEKADAEKAKEAAESEKQKANEALAGEKVKTDSAERALESLKKAQAMSDPIVTEFKTLFNEVQRLLGRLKELSATAGENKERLESALAKLAEAFEVGGEG